MTIPVRPRWIPATYQQADIDTKYRPAGESHYLEFKSELGRTESIRKTLASLANDSGTVIYGIEEDKKTRVATGLSPVRLDGAAERLQQIANSLDPVLTIEEPIELENPTNPEVGIIIVNVPASPMAPHQDDGKYHMRSGTVTVVMPDAQVARLIGERNAAGAPAVNLFPTVGGMIVPHTSLSMWVAAVPRPVRDVHLLGESLAGNRNAQEWINERLRSADQELGERIDDSSLHAQVLTPGLSSYLRHAAQTRRSGTVSLRTEDKGWLNSYANSGPDPRVHLLEISESGGVGLFANYLSEWRSHDGDPRPRNFQWRRACGLAYAVALLSKNLIDSVGYQADIDVAVRISGLEGCFPEEPGGGLQGVRADMRIAEREPIIDNNYEEQTAWSFAEYVTGSVEPMQRLFGPLLRSMGLDDFH